MNPRSFKQISSMKKAILIFAALITTFLIVLVYQRYYSSEAIIGKENCKHAKMINKGMSKLDVIDIMGEPKSGHYVGNSLFVFNYDSGNVDSMDIEIKFDSSGQVLDVFIPDHE